MTPFKILALCAAFICLASAKPALRASSLCDLENSNYELCKLAGLELCERVSEVCRNGNHFGRLASQQQQQQQDRLSHRQRRSYVRKTAYGKRIDDSDGTLSESSPEEPVTESIEVTYLKHPKPFNDFPKEDSHDFTEVPRVHLEPTADPNFIPTNLPYDRFDGMAYSFESQQANHLPGVTKIEFPEERLTPNALRLIKTLFE